MLEPSARAMAELRKRAPDFPADEFRSAVGVFSIVRRHQAQPPAAVRASLAKIVEAAHTLYGLLSTRGDELNDYLGAECVAFGRELLPEEIAPDVIRLAYLAEHAATEASKRIAPGRGADSTTRFIAALAWALEQRGIAPTARANGPLVNATAIGLGELGIELVSDCGSSAPRRA